MRKALCALLLTVLLALCVSARAKSAEQEGIRLAQTASGRGAEYVSELSDWKFGWEDEEAYMPDYDDSGWEDVTLPHTWNALDGADGGNNYERDMYFYRRYLDIDSLPAGKRLYLEFLGANQQTDLYVNGVHTKLSGSGLYTHSGGYTAFRYDVTGLLQTGRNTIAVQVNNASNERIAPISGDFNMYGGLYRRVFLVTVDEVHVDLSNYGSSGLFLTTPNVRGRERPEDFGRLNIRADIVNDGASDREITVTAHIDGDSAPGDISRALTVPAGGSVSFHEDVVIPEPHLWHGIDSSGKADASDVGYRYTVTLTVSDGEKTIDAVSDKVGFRYFYVDKETGFYLNGEPYPLRGVNRHQYKEGVGSAMTEADHDGDMALILELGANTVRLCHYPQTDYFYDLCDENGIVVWTEIPLVNLVGTSKGFMEVTKRQLTELIRQQYNRPSICFWGLHNELQDNGRNSFYSAKNLLTELDALAHEEDISGRYTAMALNSEKPTDNNDPSILYDDSKKNGWKTDLVAWNIYPGWYGKFPDTFEETADHILSIDSRPTALSEYGWGASTEQHELYPELGKNDLYSGSHWHPEEYQSLMHEQALRYINQHQNLWAAYVWVMFDFDVDSRNEGSRKAQNDKGLVTGDRQTKKDSFYLYKANWNKKEPFVHITSSRYDNRETETTYIKVYSNCGSVTLYRNEELVGEMNSLGNGVFMLEDVSLLPGENSFSAIGVMGETTCEDSCALNCYGYSIPIQGVWASSVENDNIPEFAVDNNPGTRWVALDNSYPQSITVDLGETCILNGIIIQWFHKSNRYYTYTIEVSEDNETYVLAADLSGNSKPAETFDDLHFAQGRYVRINLLSCSDAKGYAAIYSIALKGIRPTSK
ncbi:MAG: discoidin domain-containing protein [Clostridia bacterium]|nr:discoidin domain-containing protein [Clostridia bacterium]